MDTMIKTHSVLLLQNEYRILRALHDLLLFFDLLLPVLYTVQCLYLLLNRGISLSLQNMIKGAQTVNAEVPTISPLFRSSNSSICFLSWLD